MEPTTEVQISFKLEADLRNQFKAATKKRHQPSSSQVIRELMRAYIESTDGMNNVKLNKIEVKTKTNRISTAEQKELQHD